MARVNHNRDSKILVVRCARANSNTPLHRMPTKEGRAEETSQGTGKTKH